jgi:pimeloyl-ACP methyl ester carboxylesterase
MPAFAHDSLEFYYRESGRGTPFFFQHGLGGDCDQPFGLYAAPPGIRLLCLDCRAHGQTAPLGPEEKISLTQYVDDLRALADRLRIGRAVVGGISMGAAVALSFALRHPDRVAGLVLSRPAWLAGPMQRNGEIFAKIAQLIRQFGPGAGKAKFQESDMYLDVLGQSKDNAQSLLGQFDHPRAAEAAARLERIPRDAPCRDLAELARIQVPTLVLANRQDAIHPFAYGQTLARKIAGAEFREVTSKNESPDRHAADVRGALDEFLLRHFLGNT